MQDTIVHTAALRATLDPERRGRYWVSSCLGLGGTVHPLLGLSITDTGVG